MRLLRRLFTILIVLAVLGGGVYLYTQRQAEQAVIAEQQRKANIRTVKIERGNLILTVSANGVIAADKSSNIGFDTPGVVAEILVKEGDRVAEKQIVARLVDTAQQLSLNQAKANLKVAELNKENLLKPVDPRDIAAAEANVTVAQGSYQALFTQFSPQAIEAARQRYVQAQTAAELAVQRRRDAGGQYPGDSPQYLLAVAQEGQAAFTAEIARLQYAALQAGPDRRLVAAASAQITAAKARVELLKAGPPQLQVDQTNIAIEQAKVGVEQAQRALDNTVLRAPFAGVIGTVLAKIGTLTSTGVPAMILIDDQPLRVDVTVDEIDIGQLQEGQPVTLTLDALSDAELTGSIRTIALISTQLGTVTNYTVRVDLDPTDQPVKVGMTANTTVTVREVTNVIRVPNTYVRIDRRLNQAFVNLFDTEGNLTEVQVTLGLRTDEYSEVIAGLQEGDTVGIDLSGEGFSIF